MAPGTRIRRLRRRRGLALRARERQQLPALVRSAPRRRCRHRRSGLCRNLLVAEPAHHRRVFELRAVLDRLAVHCREYSELRLPNRADDCEHLPGSAAGSRTAAARRRRCTTSYNAATQRWSNEAAAAIQGRRALSLAGGPLYGEDRGAVLRPSTKCRTFSRAVRRFRARSPTTTSTPTSRPRRCRTSGTATSMESAVPAVHRIRRSELRSDAALECRGRACSTSSPSSTAAANGPAMPGSPRCRATTTGGSHKFNFKAGTNYKVTENLMLYAIFSQGFRDGGVNGGIGPSCVANGAPNYSSPTRSTISRSAGSRRCSSGRMTWNGALYYMPWKDYQVPVYDLAICPSTFNANIGNARIYGAESNVDYRITEGLTVQASMSYDDSKLTSNKFQNPDYVVFPGERLPFVAIFQYSANARYERPLSPALRGYRPVRHRATRATPGAICAPPTRTALAARCSPAYEISNLRSVSKPRAGAGRVSSTSATCSTPMPSFSRIPAITIAGKPRICRASSACAPATAGGRRRLGMRPGDASAGRRRAHPLSGRPRLVLLWDSPCR